MSNDIYRKASQWLSGKESTCNTGDLQGMWAWSLGQEDPLKKEMATHPSILAWIISQTEEPGRIQFTGLHRVRYDWATKQQQQ